MTLAAIIIVGRRRSGQVDVAQLFISGQERPDIGVALFFDRLGGPSLGALLAFLRDRVETPLELTRADIVAANMSWGVLQLRHIVMDRRTDNDRIPYH